MATDFLYDVFFSHSTKDKAVVRPLAERLRADGLKVWFDEWEIKPGDSIPAKIEEGLERSRVLVLCMSANAFGSDWTQLEAGTFRFRDPLNRERRFIPLRLDDAPIKGSLAQFLYINWQPAGREKEYANLLAECRPPDSTSATRRALREGSLEESLGKQGAKFQVLGSQPGRRIGRYVLVLSASISEMDRSRATTLINHLKLLSQDAQLTLEKIEEGSVRLVLLGTFEGWERLRTLLVSDKLSQEIGIGVVSLNEFDDLQRYKCMDYRDGAQTAFNEVQPDCRSQTQYEAVPVALKPAGEPRSRPKQEEEDLWRQADEEARKRLPRGVRFVRTLRGHKDRIGEIAWSPDGRVLASPSDDKTIKLWDVQTGACLATLRGHLDRVFCVGFDPKSRLLASGSADNTIQLWHTATCKPLATLRGHAGWVWSVAFDPTGVILASGSADNTVRLWDIASVTMRAALKGHQDYVNSISFDPAGGLIASAGNDGLILLWDAKSLF